MLCHPLESSFNAKIAKTVCGAVRATGNTVVFRDLYRDSFDPVLSEDELKRKYSFDEGVQSYMDEVKDADVLVFIHPDWWGQVPALLKGWLDRVFRPGVAYDYAGDDFLPKRLDRLLTGKKGIVYCTTNRAERREIHPLAVIWQEDIFEYCGIEGFCRIFYSVHESTSSQRKSWLGSVIEDISSLLLSR